MRKLIGVLAVAGLLAAITPTVASAAVVRTTMKCSGPDRSTYSTAVPPYTGYFERRVAYYNSGGVRVYLSPYYYAGRMSPYTAAFGGYGWNSRWVQVRTGWRALVVYRDIHDTSSYWSGWSRGGCQ